MDLPHHNHSSRFWAALKIGTPHRICSSQSASTSATEPVVVSDDSATANDMVEPSNSNNIAANEAWQHGGHKWGVLRHNSYLLYSWSKTNINLFLPQVKVFLPCSHHNRHLHLHPWPISLLSPLLGMSSLQVQQPSSLAAHIPQKTKQSITGGEFVELDCLLPVRKLMPQYKYLPGLSISFEFWEQTGQCSHTPLQEKNPHWLNR